MANPVRTLLVVLVALNCCPGQTPPCAPNALKYHDQCLTGEWQAVAAKVQTQIDELRVTLERPQPHRSSRVLRDFQRLHPCPANGRKIGACPGFVKDHVIPLCAGGPDAVSNLQWQSVAEAKAKDRLERKQCRK